MTNAVQRAEDPTPRPNRTGLPDQLKSGVEALSGLSLDHVKVHYNSAQPAQLNALAYAQGGDIHVAPGQEKHLPHEAWHVVQQMQGRVKPTMQMKGRTPVNDDAGLEKEAKVMGGKALSGAVSDCKKAVGSAAVRTGDYSSAGVPQRATIKWPNPCLAAAKLGGDEPSSGKGHVEKVAAALDTLVLEAGAIVNDALKSFLQDNDTLVESAKKIPSGAHKEKFRQRLVEYKDLGGSVSLLKAAGGYLVENMRAAYPFQG